MKFDEYVKRSGIALTGVGQFPGFVVEIGMPAGWEPERSAPGLRLWCHADEKAGGSFCANAVLTTHIAAADLDEEEVFAMLADEQMQSVPGCEEQHRDVASADDGIGIHGLLALQIPAHEFGAIESVSRSRIIKYGPETMIAQLTVTALLTSAVNHDAFWMTVRPGAAPAGVIVQTHSSGGQ
ncbi:MULTISPECIES: hypothetical protein [Mycobacterium]|uniref:Uncharacterized protein n=1 Tax=Mycobacterium kiyosense TaxID=2871094 RepID=A0A9P3Q3A8_9MYCO|nr:MULTISPECIES: hypothetical protein [Mycobacterium]BDB40900.1 hypothetical protein IWGMT90018_13460 [Mycobacterium kiyosense]BDE12696.1 hypothetical protein MKCMC460_15560 [Mycobacterium sp. 20KCMC460]GLB82637.1 hypothetical protein SRL2020028_18930 [Mycobacterium kiyosense]GLB87857.1 hypothetical protein SRL2020130_06740 [Mycobacterium kiyosense]GLB94014.1 hypothetical protein SRL2020226_07900 [Mycobacterium kiyosense]